MNDTNVGISKGECHSKVDGVFNDYETALKSISNNKAEDIQRTIKQFIQIDSLSTNTENNIQKSTQILDQVLDKKLSILSTVKSLKDIQQSLDLDTIVKNNWHTS